MFYTLTANPAVDMTVSCPPLVPNENIRSFSASYTANGKGLYIVKATASGASVVKKVMIR